MLEFFADHIDAILSAVFGGGAVALFLIPETRASKRLDNAERVLKSYESMMQEVRNENIELKKEMESLRETVASVKSENAELKTKMHTMELINLEDRALRCEKMSCKKRIPVFDADKLDNVLNHGDKRTDSKDNAKCQDKD